MERRAGRTCSDSSLRERPIAVGQIAVEKGSDEFGIVPAVPAGAS